MKEEYYDLRRKVDWGSLSDSAIDDVIRHRMDAYRARPQPKRQGYVIERIADMENLRAADDEAQVGKMKNNRPIQQHNRHKEKELRQLQRMILTLSFPEIHFRVEILKTDAGKERELAKKSYYPWKILDHAIMRVIWPVMYKGLIHDTCACIKGRGIHFAVKRMKTFIRRYPDMRYFWKTDYKKFYQSIQHDVVMEEFRKKFKDEHFLKLVEMVVCNYDSGPDVEKALSDEREKRIHNRSLHESADRQLHCKQD